MLGEGGLCLVDHDRELLCSVDELHTITVFAENHVQEKKMIHQSVRLPGRCASQCRRWPSNGSFAAILLIALALLISACGERSSTNTLAQQAEAISLRNYLKIGCGS
jgi:hypothetical protein